MNSHNLNIWAKIQAQLVLVEAYKAANELRASQGNAQAYSEKVFIDIYHEISRLANSFDGT